jgi:integrase
MPRASSLSPRAYRNAQKPHLKFVVSIPEKLWAAESRKKAFFEDRPTAKAFSERLERDLERANSLAFQLTESQRHEAAECFALLVPRGRGLREATEFFLAHLDVAERSAKIVPLVEEFLAAKRSACLSDAYIAPLASRLNAFAADHPETLVSDLSVASIETWLISKAKDPVTRNNIRRNLGTLFSFAVSRRYITSNPIKEVAKAKETEKEIEALTVGELNALLHACDGILLPFIAIGAFAGIRPEEIKGLRWSHVDFEHKEIDVPKEVSKTGQRRIVKMQPVLVAWLANYTGRTGMILSIDPRNRFEAARARLAETGTLTRWPNDVLRHGFASNHLAQWKDAPALALQMGHIDNRLIFSNYAKVVTERDAAAYWNLYPEGPLPT